jgi:hypothetical protein
MALVTATATIGWVTVSLCGNHEPSSLGHAALFCGGILLGQIIGRRL